MGPDRQSDEELVAATRHEPEAFGAFYRRHERAMLVYFLPRTTSAEVAADLTAEVFAAALASSRRFRPGKAPAVAWLYGIARNKLASGLARGRLAAEPAGARRRGDRAGRGAGRCRASGGGAALVLAAGAAAATGLLPITSGHTAHGTYTVERRPVPPVAPGEPSRGTICLQLVYQGANRPTVVATRPPGRSLSGSWSPTRSRKAHGNVSYGLVADDIARVAVLGEGGERTDAATEPKPEVPSRFFAVVVPHRGRIDVLGYDADGREVAWVGSLARPAHAPHSKAEAIEQGDPAAFAPTLPPASHFTFEGHGISEAEVRPPGTDLPRRPGCRPLLPHTGGTRSGARAPWGRGMRDPERDPDHQGLAVVRDWPAGIVAECSAVRRLVCHRWLSRRTGARSLNPSHIPGRLPASSSLGHDRPHIRLRAPICGYTDGVPGARGNRCRGFVLVLALTVALFALLAPGAFARSAYLGDANSNAISVLDTQTDQVLGSPIGVGAFPFGVAITPDGKTAYVANEESNTVSVLSTQTNQVLGSPITVGSDPAGVAITPDGKTAYVANIADGTVSVLDTQTDQVLGSPIGVGAFPAGIAITPDGRTAYVTDGADGTVSVLDTQTNQVLGSPIPVGESPFGIAITPDGKTAYVANEESNTVSVINTQMNQTVSSIAVGLEPLAVAITPDGRTAYVTDAQSDSVSAIDTQTNQVLGSPITVGSDPAGIAITPDGKTAYVTNFGDGTVSVLDTQTNQVLGSPIPVGESPFGIAITPDQPPLASFTASAATAGAPVSFDASASSDPDGTIASYAWSFGDGQSGAGGPTSTHTYGAPGTYTATLTLTDNEGCSTIQVFTGQTVSCNGSALAMATQTVTVGPVPAGAKQPLQIRVKCSGRAKPGGCGFKLQVVSAKPKKGKGHKNVKAAKPTAESAVAKAKLKAGHSALVTLKPRPKFASKLAGASEVLVRETVTVKGSTRTTYRRLKVIR